MRENLIVDPAAVYFEGEERHLFFLCTTKEADETERTQWIVEREPSGYAAVWPSIRTYLGRDGTPIDMNLLNGPQEIIELAAVGAYIADIPQCYTAEQALRELGCEPEAFTIERIGYYPSVRQARGKLRMAELTETSFASSVKDAKAAIYRGLKAKQKPRLLTLSEIRNGDSKPGSALPKETSFAKLRWTGEPFSTERFQTASSSGFGGINHYDETDTEY